MAEIVFLGTASAVAYEGHENSYLVLKGKESSILIDCAANTLLRLKKAGVSKIVTTNCIEHRTNKIDVTPLLFEALKKEK